MRRKDTGSVRITSAARPHSEDLRHRERRYIVSMTIRTVCFLLSVFTMGHWVMWVFLAGAVFLPYVAVVLANGGASPDPGGPDPFDPEHDFRALGG